MAVAEANLAEEPSNPLLVKELAYLMAAQRLYAGMTSSDDPAFTAALAAYAADLEVKQLPGPTSCRRPVTGGWWLTQYNRSTGGGCASNSRLQAAHFVACFLGGGYVGCPAVYWYVSHSASATKVGCLLLSLMRQPTAKTAWTCTRRSVSGSKTALFSLTEVTHLLFLAVLHPAVIQITPSHECCWLFCLTAGHCC